MRFSKIIFYLLLALVVTPAIYSVFSVVNELNTKNIFMCMYYCLIVVYVLLVSIYRLPIYADWGERGTKLYISFSLLSLTVVSGFIYAFISDHTEFVLFGVGFLCVPLYHQLMIIYRILRRRWKMYMETRKFNVRN